MRRALDSFRKRFTRKRSKGMMASRQRDLYRADRPPDVASQRAKSQRHGKVTAYRWNQ